MKGKKKKKKRGGKKRGGKNLITRDWVAPHQNKAAREVELLRGDGFTWVVVASLRIVLEYLAALSWCAYLVSIDQHTLETSCSCRSPSYSHSSFVFFLLLHCLLFCLFLVGDVFQGWFPFSFLEEWECSCPVPNWQTPRIGTLDQALAVTNLQPRHRRHPHCS